MSGKNMYVCLSATKKWAPREWEKWVLSEAGWLGPPFEWKQMSILGIPSYKNIWVTKIFTSPPVTPV